MRTQSILSPYSVMRAFRHGHATERTACIYDNPGAMHFRFTPELVGRLSREPTGSGALGSKSKSAGAEQLGLLK